ncbi:hypothetical protein SteCoe_11440 [Stentor coeruleus]|uniref:Exocyst complex component Sec10-like alpha-helical bundle domain-containing protein n=1 Tax=Stentor coeruleus TaxID=5963 RepID=A0A1R2CD83_9CILI|nr:hypothetical protein SteCoe_11440 [Stentor coeruleus]
MDSFNSINFCEGLLKSYEIVSLSSLEKALQEVKKKVENEKESALKSIEKIQQSIQEKGGIDISYQLLERQARAHKDLESARILVKELNRDYDKTSVMLENKEMQRKNAILLKNLVLELDNFNLNQSDIEIDPRHLIYLKHALESLDLPEYNTAQQAIEKKFTETKKEYFEKFAKSFVRKDVKSMKEAYDILVDFSGQQECIDFYVDKVTESLEIKDQQDDFYKHLKYAISEIEGIVNREIVGNYVKLLSIFGENSAIVEILLTEILELKLKPFIHKHLDSDIISSQNFLEYLASSYVETLALTSRIKSDISQLSLDLSLTIDHLFSNIFSPFLSSYFTMEFRSLKGLVEGSFEYILEPLNMRIQRKSIDIRLVTQSPEEDIRNAVDQCTDSVLRNKKNSIMQELEAGLVRCKKLSQSGEESANSAQLITIVLDICYTGIYHQILTKLSSCLEYKGIKGFYIGKIFYLIADLAAYVRDFNKEIAKKISTHLQISDSERCESLRKRVSASIDQKIMKSLHQSVILMSSESENILKTHQKKTDYCGIEENLDNTEACTILNEYLLEQIANIKKSLPYSQYSKLLTSLGQKLTNVIVNHICGYIVSQEKALLLSSDMNKYRNLILLCENEKVVVEFEKFRQMMNLFMLPAQSLPEFIHEEPIASISTEILAEFISHRKDFKTGKVSKLLPSIFNS